MRFEWNVLREPESTTAQKLVSGVSEVEVISANDIGGLKLCYDLTVHNLVETFFR